MDELTLVVSVLPKHVKSYVPAIVTCGRPTNFATRVRHQLIRITYLFQQVPGKW